MNKLRPCPFCGEELITIANGQYYSHKREQDKEKQCFGGVWTFPVDDEEFIKLWNTRKPMDKALSKLEALAAEYEERANNKLLGAEKKKNLAKMHSYRYAYNIVKDGGIGGN